MFDIIVECVGRVAGEMGKGAVAGDCCTVAGGRSKDEGVAAGGGVRSKSDGSMGSRVLV